MAKWTKEATCKKARTQTNIYANNPSEEEKMAAPAARFPSALIPAGASTEALKTAFLGKNVLFYITRSMNTNAVVYEANLVDGKLNTAEPVKVYWIMYAQDNHEEVSC